MLQPGERTHFGQELEAWNVPGAWSDIHETAEITPRRKEVGGTPASRASMDLSSSLLGLVKLIFAFFVCTQVCSEEHPSCMPGNYLPCAGDETNDRETNGEIGKLSPVLRIMPIALASILGLRSSLNLIYLEVSKTRHGIGTNAVPRLRCVVVQQVDEFNVANRWRKRGLAVIPTKFGIWCVRTVLGLSIPPQSCSILDTWACTWASLPEQGVT